MTAWSTWERYLYRPVAPERARVLARVVPLLLTFDTWLLMIGHAGRYGVGEFNVAHFDWLDRLLPLPSPPIYIALLLVTGVLALVSAMAKAAPRRMFAAICLLYTLSWSMSMLDSYQHHYFLSLLLFCLAFFPDGGEDGCVSAEERGGADTLASHGGYAALTTTIAIVYAYAAVAKCEPVWLSGHTLARLTRVDPALEALKGVLTWSQGHAPLPQAWLRPLEGLRSEALLSLQAAIAIPIEFSLAVAYLLAPLRDRWSGRGGAWLRSGLNLALVLALALHVGAELMNLSIGWFSYYMLLLSLCCLGPAAIPRALLKPMSGLGRTLGKIVDELRREAAGPRGARLTIALAATVGGLHLYVGHALNLPGALAAGVALTIAASAWTLWRSLRRQQPADTIAPNLALLCAGLLLWGGVAASDVRFDFYRFLGGDRLRRGELREALAAYEQAERYAPPGKSRRPKINALRERIAQAGP